MTLFERKDKKNRLIYLQSSAVFSGCKSGANDIEQATIKWYPMMHFCRSIMQYCSHGRFHCEVRSFSCQLFFWLISVPVKVRKLQYFVIWHDFSDLQWLMSEVSTQKHLFSLFHLFFASQSVQWPTTLGHEYSQFFGLQLCWSLQNVDLTPAKWSPEYCTG